MHPKERNIVGTRQNRQSLTQVIDSSILLTQSEKRVYIHLKRMTVYTKSLYPTDKQIAAALGLGQRTVNRAISNLKKKGLLFVRTLQTASNKKRRNMAIKWKVLFRFFGIKPPKTYIKPPFKGGTPRGPNIYLKDSTGGSVEPSPPSKKPCSAEIPPETVENMVLDLSNLLKPTI